MYEPVTFCRAIMCFFMHDNATVYIKVQLLCMIIVLVAIGISLTIVWQSRQSTLGVNWCYWDLIGNPLAKQAVNIWSGRFMCCSLQGHSLDSMLHMESSPLRPGGQRPYNGATSVGGGRWPVLSSTVTLSHLSLTSLLTYTTYWTVIWVVPNAGRLCASIIFSDSSLPNL